MVIGVHHLDDVFASCPEFQRIYCLLGFGRLDWSSKNVFSGEVECHEYIRCISYTFSFQPVTVALPAAYDVITRTQPAKLSDTALTMFGDMALLCGFAPDTAVAIIARGLMEKAVFGANRLNSIKDVLISLAVCP